MAAQLVLDLVCLTLATPAGGWGIPLAGADRCVPWGLGVQPQRLLRVRAGADVAVGCRLAWSMEPTRAGAQSLDCREKPPVPEPHPRLGQIWDPS